MIGGDGLFTVITSGGVVLFVSACILICIYMCLYLRFINAFVFTCYFFVFDYSCIFSSCALLWLYFNICICLYLHFYQILRWDCCQQVIPLISNGNVWLQSTNAPIWQVLVIIGYWKCIRNIQHWHFWCVFEQEKHTLLLLSLNHQARELALLKRPHIAKCQNLALLRAVNVSYFSFSCRFDSTFISTFSLKLQAEIWDRKLFKEHL